MLRFGVLGPLEATSGPRTVNLKGPRHRAVLARLLIAKGRVVPVSWLIDDLWDDPPEGALGAVQTFVGALRKALEPDRPPRVPSRLLVTVAPGYALRTGPDAVDAARFEAAVVESGRLLTAGRAHEARAALDQALGLWRGPAYAEFAEQDWARAEAGRLEELRLVAVVRRAEAALALGQAADAAPEIEAHVAAHPLREDGWGVLALALYRMGRQGDALAALRRAREALRTALGVDPGPELRRLEADILAQAPNLSAPERGVAPASPAVRALDAHAFDGGAFGGGTFDGRAFDARAFVGRVDELAMLEKAVAGGSRLSLISGVAGAGKTELARIFATRLAANGWTVAWGSSSEHPGAPAAWPWSQIAASLVGAGHPPAPEAVADRVAAPGMVAVPGVDRVAAPGMVAASDADRVAVPGMVAASDDDPLAAQFRRHRAIGAYLAGISAQRPVLLVFDDLHWADEETLALLAALTADPDLGAVRLIGTYRSTEISAGLTEALGRVARAEPTRIYLGGLSEPEVSHLVRAVSQRPVSAEQARVIHARSSGNPFFVRELTRLWEAEGDAGLHSVPAGVRDVIRQRLQGLAEPARIHLRQAAILGEEVDLELLIALVGDEDRALSSVESALLAGFLVEPDADRLRFAHALVLDTLYADIPRTRRARWHAVAGELLERIRPGDVEAIARHFLRAESQATAGAAARYARAAAERALPHQAVHWWREVIGALDRSCRATLRSENAVKGGRAGARRLTAPAPTKHGAETSAAITENGATPAENSAAATDNGVAASAVATRSAPETSANITRDRLDAVMGLVRALAVTGDLAQARQLRAEALDTAEALGDPALTADVLGAFDVPAIWTTNDDEALSRRIVAAAEAALTALPDQPAAARARLLVTIAMERRADAEPGSTGMLRKSRGREAAEEAERIARELGDARLLAFALNGRFLQTFHRAGLAPERARIGRELLELAARPGEVDGQRGSMPTFEVLGHLILVQASAALADLDRAGEHAAAADRLAERYGLPVVSVFTDFYRALRLAVTGRRAEAEAAYRTVAARLPGTGMFGVEPGILPLALLSLGVPVDDCGPYEPWTRPVTLLRQGDRAGAVAAALGVPESPRDLLFEARTCLHASVAVHTGDRRLLERLYAQLQPASGELAGAGSGLVTFGPVARYLGDLARALDRFL